jgi:uncharacterized UPF0160 family protein
MTTTQPFTTDRAVTHSGDSHPDDVMSGALLREVFPGITITRTRDPRVLAAAMADDTIVFDVGGEYMATSRNFDHHQREGAPAPRINGVGYSSFGLLWEEFGYKYCEAMIWEFGLDIDPIRLVKLVDTELVQGIDVLDAGQIKDPNFRPLVGEVPIEMATFGLALFRLAPQPLLFAEPNYDSAYEEAVAMAQKFLRRFAEACLAKLYGSKLICEGRLVEDRIVVVHKTIPDWSDVVSAEFEEALYYIDPDTSDPTGQAYMVWQVPTAPRAFSGRKPLPEAWAGKRLADLEATTGIKGVNFCHGARFVCGGKTLEAALAMARAAIAAE